MKHRYLFILVILSIGSMLLGLPYIYRIFQPMEAEVMEWGRVSVDLGAITLVLSLLFYALSIWLKNTFSKIPILRWLRGLFIRIPLIAMIAIQVPPIFYWFYLSGGSASDDRVVSGRFVVHWAYSLPHILILLGSAYLLIKRDLFHSEKSNKEKDVFL